MILCVDRNKLWRCLEDLGLQGRLTEFLRAAYTELKCEVKVGEKYSEPFSVENGLRQGCILSPLLFSLYINSLIVDMKMARMGWFVRVRESQLYCTQMTWCCLEKMRRR